MDIGKLGDSKEFLKILMGCLKNIIFIVDDEIIINDFSSSFIKAFKLNPDEIIGRRCGEVFGCVHSVDEKKDCGKTSVCMHCEIREGFLNTINKNIEVEKQQVSLKLYIDKKLEEKYFYFSTRLVKYEGDEKVLAVLDDITELEKSKRKAVELASIDSLTGINNRRNIIKILEGNFQTAKKHGGKFSIIMADIDNFKGINDELGHQKGDEVIQNTAKAIKEELRSADHTGRYGGEEFLMVLPSTNLEEASLCAERIRKKIEKMTGNSEEKVTLSLGVVEYREDVSLKNMIKRADMLLYKAKKNGKNRVE